MGERAVFHALIGLVHAPWQVLGPAVARGHLGGPAAWAAISVALGAGALAGGFLGIRWRPRRPLRVAFLAFLVSGPALLILLGAHASLAAIIPMALLDGAASSLFNAWWFTAQQIEVPPAELSRVSSWDYLGTLIFEPAGLVAVGPVALAVGVSSTLYGAAAIGVLLAVAVLLVPEVRNFSPRKSAPPLTRVGA